MTRLLFGFCALTFAVSAPNAFSAASEDEEAEVEEVIVTGSYIRRDNFDLPSPIDVTTELDIELAGTTDLGDIIFDQTFQYGVNANATPFEGNSADNQEWNQGQEVWANLRGLGTRATMTMIDGHRLPADTNTWGRRAGVDINGTYPSNAIGRIETILDGASAIYGAEAVGGVINLIPKKDFEGLELSYDFQQAIDGGSPITTLGLLAGIQGERGGAIFAIEMRDQERMRFTERPDFILSSADPWAGLDYTPWWHDRGDGGLPGTFNVPIRNTEGELMPLGAPGTYDAWDATRGRARNYDHFIGHSATGPVSSVERADPGCGYGFGGGNDDWGEVPAEWSALPGADRFASGQTAYNDLSKHGNFLNGMFHAHSVNGDFPWNAPRCIMSVSDMQDMQAEAELNKGMAYFEYEFNEYVKLRGEIVISTNDYNTRDVTSEFDELDTNELNGPMSAVVIGHNPGNPFRAFADGSTYDPTGSSSFAGGFNGALDWEDVNGNGLYEYGVEPGEYYVFASDANGDGIPDRDYDGDGVPDLGASADINAMVVLLGMGDSDGNGVADRFDQDWALANGGIRLFEDVRPHTYRLTTFAKNPRNNTLSWMYNDDGIAVYKRRFVRDNVRLRLGGEFAIPETDWIIDADYVWTKGARENTYPEPNLPAFINALRCQGGSDTSAQAAGGFSYGGQGSCWNPFTTSYLNTNADGQLIGTAWDRRGGYSLDPEYLEFPDPSDPGWRPFYVDSNGDGSIDPRIDAISPEVNTEEENRQAGVILAYNLQDLGMQLFDVVGSTSNLFALPWNDQPVGFAIGTHWRLETEEWKPSLLNQSNLGGGKRGLRESEQETMAVFAEFQLPLLEHERFGSAELQIAARYAEIETRGKIGVFGESKFDTTIPKIALRYQPTDWLAFRGSMTEGFVTPGLYAMFGTAGQYSGPATNGGGRGTVSDYICDYLPEIGDCVAAGTGGGVPNVFRGSAPNQDLEAEESELWNAGFTLRLFDGDLVFDADYTEVEFNGKTEQIGAGINVRINEVGFYDYLQDQCPGTIPNWDDATNPDSNETLAALSNADYIAQTSQAELDCRLNSAVNWVLSDANGGLGEQSIGNSVLTRGDGPNGLTLTEVDEPWVEQGQQTTRTMIYGVRYNMDWADIPFVGGDYGSFVFTLSATQMIESSIQRYTSFGCDASLIDSVGRCPGDHPYAGIEVDGVGNRNASNYGFNGPGDDLYEALAPTPEFRVNAGIRWFMGNHTAQLFGTWHDSVTNYHIAWDELKERGLLSASNAQIAEKDRCNQQPSCVGNYPAEMYWNLSYTYFRPDVFGADLNLNVSIRNIFDNFPEPRAMPSGFEGYLDNIMGRMAYVRLTLSI
jgi:outer membrane receptor protein involved in Fe transport